MKNIDAYTTELDLARAKSEQIGRIFEEEYSEAHSAARRKMRRVGECAGDILAWGRKFLPRHFGLPPSQMHRWLAKRLGAFTTARGQKLNVLGPRGGAKSTLVTLAYVLRAALERQEPYIWIVSDTRHQAIAHLESLKAELTENEALGREYPEAAGKGPRWQGSSIVLRNGAAIEAFGTGQRLRGRRRREHRPTLIVCDDLQNDEHIRSVLRRSQSREWFQGMLLKAGAPQTNVVNLATALHGEALAMQLHETAGWKSRIFKSIVEWPKEMSLWAEWEEIYGDLENRHCEREAREFYEKHRAAMDAGAIVLWPEREDLYALMRMRFEGGRGVFEREKQNSPVNQEGCEWPESYFDEGIWYDSLPIDLLVKTMALDPSKGADARRGDYSAYVMLAVDRRGILYFEADMSRRPTPQMVIDGINLLSSFQPQAFGVEANQYQELLVGAFEAEIRRRWVLGVRPIGMENQVNKKVRIRRLGQYLATKRMRFKTKSPGTKLLVEQLKEFPQGDHDDGPDAAEMALRLAGQILQVHSFNDGLGNRLPI